MSECTCDRFVVYDNEQVFSMVPEQSGGSGGGGGGSATDYASLSNKPSINGITLNGNKIAADLNLIAAPSSPSSGAFLVYNGSSWVAKTLAVWQGGSY